MKERRKIPCGVGNWAELVWDDAYFYGVDKDIAKARSWYEKAVSQGASMTAARKHESLPISGK